MAHRCREGEAIGMEWKPYPYVVTYCRVCKAKMREIPVDDAPSGLSILIRDIVSFMRNRKRGA